MKPPHCAAEQMSLLDGLGRPHVSQFRRSICGAHDHRHIALMRLNDRTVEMGCSSTRGAQKNRWNACGQSEAKCSERGAAFVMEQMDPYLRACSKGYGQWG
jgi:hypothetical protein